MFFKASRRRANRISILIAAVVVLYALLWNEGGENFNKLTDPVHGAAQIMTLGSPLVTIESTDEVYEMALQAAIIHRLSAQRFKNKVVSESVYAILEFLLAAVTVILLYRLVHIWLHRSQEGIVCYIHDKDGKK